MWRSGLLSIPADKLPLRFKFVANGHRHSPNTRPLIWDSASRVVERISPDGCVRAPAAVWASTDVCLMAAASSGSMSARTHASPAAYSVEALAGVAPCG